MRSYNPTYKPNLVQLRRAAEMLTAAERPLILLGGGVVGSDSSGILQQLAEDYSIPVVSTLMGLSGFPGNHDLWYGMIGMHGSAYGNRAITEADLILAVGTRFADRVTGKLSAFAKSAKIVHIDIDPTSIRKNVSVDVPVVAHCKEALHGLSNVLSSCGKDTDFLAKHSRWLEHLGTIRTDYPLSYGQNEYVKPQEVIKLVCEISKGNAIVTTEVGQNQMWAAQFFTFTKPRTFLSSGGLGTMGYGLPAAMGAQFADPDALVVAIAGDGSIQMNIQEMATIVEQKLPIKIIILNNGCLGMVRQWQELFYKKNYVSTVKVNQPDFVKLAEAYGAEGYRITAQQDLVETLTKALTSPHPAIIDIVIEQDENVYPMVPTGAALDEMLLT